MTVRCKLCGRKVSGGSCVACSRAMRLMGTSDVAMRVATAMMVKEGLGDALVPKVALTGKLASTPGDTVLVYIATGRPQVDMAGLVTNVPNGTVLRFRPPCGTGFRKGHARIKLAMESTDGVVVSLHEPLFMTVPSAAAGDTVLFYTV